jgi:hypothetical protein
MVPSSGNSAKLVGAPGCAFPHGVVELPVGALELLFQPPNVGGYALGHRLGGHLRAVLFGDDHLQKLTSADEDCLQSAHLLVGDDARPGAHGRSEAGEDVGVDLVGLGQAPGGFGEVAGLAGLTTATAIPQAARAAAAGRS